MSYNYGQGQQGGYPPYGQSQNGYNNVPMQTYPNNQYPQQQNYAQQQQQQQQQGYYATQQQGHFPQFPSQQNYGQQVYTSPTNQYHHNSAPAQTYPHQQFNQGGNQAGTPPASAPTPHPNDDHGKDDEIKLAQHSAFTAEDLAAEVNKQSGTDKLENKLENVVGEDTLDVAKKVINTVRKGVLTIVFFVTPIMAVVSLIMAVIAWTQFFGNFNDFQKVIDNWKKTPITDVTFTTTLAGCPSGFDLVSVENNFNKIQLNTTMCWFKNSTVERFDAIKSNYTVGPCPNGTLFNNMTIGLDSATTHLKLWRGMDVCVKRDGVPAIDRVPLTGDKCEDGYFKCEGLYPTCQQNGLSCPVIGARAHDGMPGSYDASFETPRYLSKTNRTIILQTKGKTLPLVEVRVAPGLFCKGETVGKVRPALGTKYIRYERTCENGPIAIFSTMDNATEEVMINSANIPSIFAPPDANSSMWTLNGESEVSWSCTASRAEVARSGSHIQVVFYSQMTLFILTLFSSFVTGLCIPVMLVYNGHLRSLWCGKNEVAEKDRDDLKRYNLVQVGIKCLIQTIRFAPIVAVMIIAGNYGGWFSDIAREIDGGKGCADQNTGLIFEFFSDKINKSVGVLNICLLISSILSYLGTWGSIFFVFRMIVVNLKEGRSAFSRPDSKTGTSVFSIKRLFGK